MLARFKDLVIDVNEVGSAASFWAPTLGLQRLAGRDALIGNDPSQTVWLNLVPEPHTVKNRVHLDVHVRSVEEVTERGARVLAEHGWTVMADPEGNEFCAFVRESPPAYRLYEVGIDCSDPQALAGWWATVLGGEIGTPGPGEAEEGALWWLERVPAMPFASMDFAAVPEPKTIKNRVHWDVTGLHLGGLDEIVALGATVVDEQPDWTVLADPEGNEFCWFPPAS